MAKKSKLWIQAALGPKSKGKLRRKLKAKKGKNIPMSKLKKAAKAKGKLGKESRLAMTLRKLAKRKKSK